MIKVASLRYGVIFKKAFSQPDIFKAFVKDILNIDLDIDRVETEKSFTPPIGKVDATFDLFAEDQKNRIVVDIQHVRFPDHYDRFLHYHCVALLEQVANSQNYRPPKQVFTIVVLTSGDKHQVDVAITDFEPKTLSGKPLGETPHKIIYLCPKYVSKDTPQSYRDWLRAIDDTLDEEVDETGYVHPSIQRIFELIQQDLISPTDRARMKDEYSMAQVMREKYEDGVEQGVEQGKMQREIEMAQAMLQEGFDPQIVSKITGLSEAVIVASQKHPVS